MKDENEKKLMQIFKKNKLLKNTILFFALAAIFCIALGVIIGNRELPDAVKVEDVAKLGEYVECPIYGITDYFADYTVDGSVTDRYYLASDGYYIYILNLSLTQYNDIVSKMEDETYSEDIVIYGMSESIQDELKTIAIDTYNEMYETDELTEENFYDYFIGYTINCKEHPNSSADTLYFVGGTCVVLVAVFGIIQLVLYLKTKRNIKKYGEKYDLGELIIQLTDPTVMEFPKTKTMFTRDYIVNYSDSLVIIKYDEIVWIYPFDYRVNGIKSSTKIVVVTKDKTRYMICEAPAAGKENVRQYNECMKEIINRKPNVLIGYTKDNIEAMNKKNIDNTIASIDAKDKENI